MRFFSHCRERGEDAQGKIWVGGVLGAYRYLRSNQQHSLKSRLDLLELQELDLMSHAFTALRGTIEA